MLNYFGKVYDKDKEPEGTDDSYFMQTDSYPDIVFDGSQIEQMGKYINHSGVNPSMEFQWTDEHPFAELHIIKSIKKDEEIMTDYGPGYDYSHMGPGKTRYSS